MTPTLRDPVALSNAHARPQHVAEILDDLFRGDPSERLAITRGGDREPVRAWVRRAVFMRDGARCRWCGVSADYLQLELDHIVPWSAGGSDRSENLRMLCWPCNASRSNFRSDSAIARVVPVSQYCTRCVDSEGWTVGYADRWNDEPTLESWTAAEPVAAFCAACAFEGVAEREWVA